MKPPRSLPNMSSNNQREVDNYFLQEHNYGSLNSQPINAYPILQGMVSPTSETPQKLETEEQTKFPPLLCSYCGNEVRDEVSFMKTTSDDDVEPLILCHDCHVAKFLCGNSKRISNDSTGSNSNYTTGRKKTETTRGNSKRISDSKTGTHTSWNSKKGNKHDSRAYDEPFTKVSWDEDIFVSPRAEEEPTREDSPPSEQLIFVEDGRLQAGREIKARENLAVLGDCVLELRRDSVKEDIPSRHYLTKHKKSYCVDLELGTSNITRFVQKSCFPNCRFRVETAVARTLVAHLVANTSIRMGDEITVPFTLENGPSRSRCAHCGNPCKNVKQVQANKTSYSISLASKPKVGRNSELVTKIKKKIALPIEKVQSPQENKPMSREDKKLQGYIECFEQMELKEAEKKAKRLNSGGTRTRKQKKTLSRPVRVPRAKNTRASKKQKKREEPVQNNSSDIVRKKMIILSEACGFLEEDWETVRGACNTLSLLISVMGSLVRNEIADSQESFPTIEEPGLNGQYFSDISNDSFDSPFEVISEEGAVPENIVVDVCASLNNDSMMDIECLVSASVDLSTNQEIIPMEVVPPVVETPVEPPKRRRLSLSDYHLMKRQRMNESACEQIMPESSEGNV